MELTTFYSDFAPFSYNLECWLFFIAPISYGFESYLNVPRRLHNCLWINALHFPLKISCQKTSRDSPGMAWCGKQQFIWSNYRNSKFQLKGVACVDTVCCVGMNVSYTYNNCKCKCAIIATNSCRFCMLVLFFLTYDFVCSQQI